MATLSRHVKEASVEAAAQVGSIVVDAECEEDDADDNAEGNGTRSDGDNLQEVVFDGEGEAVDKEADALLEDLLAADARGVDDAAVESSCHASLLRV